MSNATPIQGHYDTSSVFVAVIGRPNVGKSSLTNLLVGEKVAIVTSKPQTTRTRITGVITRGPLQYVLLDTPGVHKARNKLGKRMDKTASDSIADVDVSMMLFEPYGALNESEMVLVDMLRSSGGPAIAVINKTDLAPYVRFDLDRCETYARRINPRVTVLRLSAVTGVGLDAWCRWLQAQLAAASL